MRTVGVVAGVLVACAVAVGSPPAPPEQLHWAGALDAAKAEALKRNVPLLVALNMDTERGNEWMVTDCYTEPALQAAAKRCVVTIASMYPHSEVDDPRAGHKVCSKFGLVSCAEHRATEEIVRRDWLKCGPKDDVDSPRHFFLAPDGRILFQRVWTCTPDELVKLIDRAIASCKPEVLAAWDTMDARLARLTDPIQCVRQAALHDLAAAKDPQVDERLFAVAAGAKDEEVAADVLAALGAEPTPTRIAGMRKLMGAPSAKVRMQAAAAVARERGDSTFDALSAAFAKEKNLEVKCVLLRAMGVCGGDPARTREALLKVAKAGDATLRTHAVVGLAPWASDASVVEALQKMPANEKLANPLRAAACWTLGLSERKDLIESIKPATEDNSELVKRAAHAAVARLTTRSDDVRYWTLSRWVAPLPVTLPER